MNNLLLNLIHTEIMSLESQELRKIFTEIQAEFFNNRNIEIYPVSGDPPSQYEVTYHIPCTTQDEQGNVTVGSNHTVLISIPFGFPHFPPSCKPKSSIFHPDFDSAAICLGDFWSRDCTIPDLIRHIGEMLAGRIYSTENAFNEEAALWFRQNSSQLPFEKSSDRIEKAAAKPADQQESEAYLQFDDSFDFADTEDSADDDFSDSAPDSSMDPAISLSHEQEESPADISTMEDRDFVDDFHFSDDIPEAPGGSPVLHSQATSEIDTDKLKHLARRRKFCQLDTELTSTPTDIEFAERQELTDQTATALKEAQKLYADAEEYEDQGLPGKALECFKAVENLVADYPNIRADISRTENASEILEGMTADTKETKETKKKQKNEAPPARKEKKSSTAAEKTEPHTPEQTVEKVRRPTNFIPYVLTGGLLAILAPATYFYFNLGSQLTEAKQYFATCTTNFAAKDFQAAEKTCSAAMSASRGVFLFHQAEKRELQTGIRNLLDSEEMQQGLQGKVLYNGKYVASSALSAHQSLQDLLNQSQGFLDSSAWDQAAASYKKALALSDQIEDFSPEERMSIEQNLNYATFRSLLTVAETQVDKELWQEATTTLTELQTQITKLSPRQQVEYRDYVETLRAKSHFTSLKQQADTLFSQSDWAGAATLFQKAVEAGRTLSEKESKDLVGIKANISRAELYSTINAGNSLFSQGKWDEAIASYTQASSILEANAKLLNLEEVEQSRRKLDRIILQSAIIRDRQIADRNKAADKVALTQSYLQKVVDTIKASSFANDPEFQEIVAETQKAQQEIKESLYIQDKEQYLVDNYATLFLENYPAAAPETLSNPMATFEKRLGRLYLFKLQCTESGRGRPLKLIMYYTYDPDNKRWKFYSGT